MAKFSKNGRHAKMAEFVQKVKAQGKRSAELVRWDCRPTHANGVFTHQQVVDALKSSQLDPEAAREFTFEGAFKRALRKDGPFLLAPSRATRRRWQTAYQ